MQSVDVVVPLSADLDEHRTRALDLVLSRLPDMLPEQVILSQCGNGTPALFRSGCTAIGIRSSWNKPVAVNEAVLRNTCSEWVFILDADVVMDFGLVRKFLDTVPASVSVIRPCTDIVRLSFEDTKLVLAGGRPEHIRADTKVETLLCGGAFLIRRQAFMRLRGFDERFDIFMEDTDLKRRIEQAGLVVVHGSGTAYHLWHQPLTRDLRTYARILSPRKKMSPEQVRLNTVSRIPVEHVPVVEPKPEDRPKVVVACVLKTGGEYTAEHAHWLYRQVQARVRTPHRFVCITDVPDQVPFGVALQRPGKGWWCKPELFRPGIFSADETVLFLDLDTVITSDIYVPRVMPQTLYMLKSFMHEGSWCSGVMLWRGDFSGIWRVYDANPDLVRWCCHSPDGGDQELVAMSVLSGMGTLKALDDIWSVGYWEFDEGTFTKDPETTDFVCWYDKSRPWTMPDPPPWIPPLKPDVSRQWWIATWFGKKAEHNAAVRQALSQLHLDPKPQMLLVEVSETGETGFPEWPGQHLVFKDSAATEYIWQKEKLFNLGVQHIHRTAGKDAAEGFVFFDFDTFPKYPGTAEIIRQALQTQPVIQPFGDMKEFNAPQAFNQVHTRSHGWLKASGLKPNGNGVGFVIALTSDFFDACGGWPDSVTGSGDAWAVMCWDSTDAMPYRGNVEYMQLKPNYKGPKFDIGCIDEIWYHVWHGNRQGTGDTRHYIHRHWISDWTGGIPAVLEEDPDTGLWRWRDTRLAAVVKAVMKDRRRIDSKETARTLLQQALFSELGISIGIDPVTYIESHRLELEEPLCN